MSIILLNERINRKFVIVFRFRMNCAEIGELLPEGLLSVSSSAYGKLLMRYYLRRNWWWIILPMILLIVLGVVNVNFAVVGLFYGFVVVPMAMSLVYFNYAISEEMQWSVRKKTVACDSTGLLMKFTDERFKETKINGSDIREVLKTKKHLIILLRSRRYAMVAFPLKGSV